MDVDAIEDLEAVLSIGGRITIAEARELCTTSGPRKLLRPNPRCQAHNWPWSAPCVCEPA